MVEEAYRKRRAASFRTEESAPKGKEAARTGIRRMRRRAKEKDRAAGLRRETKEYEEYCERASERMREC